MSNNFIDLTDSEEPQILSPFERRQERRLNRVRQRQEEQQRLLQQRQQLLQQRQELQQQQKLRQLPIEYKDETLVNV